MATGAILPRNRGPKIAQSGASSLVDHLLVPAYFAVTGLKLRIDLLHGTDWAILTLIVAVAALSKIGSVSIGSSLLGCSWCTGIALGVLMNARGLVEIVILNIGLDTGIISERLFSLMTLMALITTGLTGPLLRAILPRRTADGGVAVLERKACDA